MKQKEPAKQLSGRTLYYMAQYGKEHHLASHIFKTSIKVLILASIFSSLGGIGLQGVRNEVLTVLPLIIVLPALTDMIGDFGTIAATKFTTAVYLGKVSGKWWKSRYTYRLFGRLLLIAIFAALYISLFSYAIALAKGFQANGTALLFKVTEITLLTTVSLFIVLFAVSAAGCRWLISRGQEPDNVLIPITTSAADFGALLMFSYLVATLV